MALSYVSAATLTCLVLQYGMPVIAQAPSTTTSYVVPAQFPAYIFTSYYYSPAATQEPQPAIYDPILDLQYPLKLTNPNTIPQNDTDPAPLPPGPANATATSEQAAYQDAISQIQGIVAGPGTNCTKCVDSFQVLQSLSLSAPDRVPDAMVALCKQYGFASNSTCEEDFDRYTLGATWTQIIRYADIQGLDGRYMCYYASTTTCPRPVVDPPLDTTNLFPKPKPANARAPPASGKRVKVAHISDIHLDPRYAVGSEANCSSSLCCRTNVQSSADSSVVDIPAPLYGAFKCDSPYFLTTGALQAVHPLTGTVRTPGGFGANNQSTNPKTLGWTIYTGDLVSHDPQMQLSRAYTEYTEASLYSQLTSFVSGPIFGALGNHDTSPVDQNAPQSLPGSLGRQFSWNYDHLAGLWQNDGIISPEAAAQARLHYGAYSVKNSYGLRLITLNTDFMYHSNLYTALKASNPDQSGMLAWLIDELQKAEDCGERVWIFGHVLTGWDGTNPATNPTDLFYQIVERYSPHVIANTFWGHTHEDELMIYYANNGTNRNNSQGLADALVPGWVGPSVTPLTNVNSGFRMYEVDTGSFEVYEAYTYYANVSSFGALDVDTTGPTFALEYSTRDAYGHAADWPATAPLNATFWHRVTETLQSQALGGNLTLTELFNTYQGKSSVMSPACNTTACAIAKVCYMRSGSAALGLECPQGYGSVQSKFKPAPPAESA